MSTARKAISALKWSVAAKLVVQAVSWAGTLVVVRLLSPEDYGLMAKVSVICVIAAAIAELGLGAAIVRWTDLARDDLRKIYGVSLLFSAGLTAAIAAAAPLLAQLFHEPRLAWPIAVASLQIIIGAVAIIPSSLAARDLSYRGLAKVEMAAGTTGIATTLLLALIGAGVWALVLGTLFAALARSTALLVYGECVRPLFSVRGIGEHLRFGLTLVCNRVSYFIVTQSDVLIGSSFLSTTEIGQYSVALQLATLPMAKVMGIINQVGLSALAREQSDPAWVRNGVLRSMRLMALIAFPALWGISAVAPELVHVLFGDNWLPAVPALAILPLIVPIRMLCSVLFTASLALGHRQLDLRNTIINLVLLPAGFFVGAHWGLLGLCAAWLVSVPIAYSFSVPGALRRIGVRMIDLLPECAPPAIAAALMYAAVTAARPALHAQPAILALGALIALGAAVYFAIMALISRRHLISMRSFARAVRGGTPTTA
ncbi:lipopolysaccharide biosynthesis protein [Noviherbaspirillum massiliense]|uniref:lipopolysaccharide biosynthesis protein n=1 Tax=Noviherbaspirillum massiliense TaxID=1465823 RepID=UPI000368C909|nr:lipopolysaccharide biosynthesis protein [Noviherbaspirillum massiliense]